MGHCAGCHSGALRYEADMTLAELLNGIADPPNGAGGIAVSGLTPDSRKVEPGFVFAALPGTEMDGARFIPQAVAAGAVAVVTHPDAETDADVPVIRSGNARQALALMAARFHGHQPETMAAVTGTSGKTSVVSFLRQLWAHGGIAAASLGTVGTVSPAGTRKGSLTTPDPVELHKELCELADAGVTHAALEASSHGLDQYRLDGIQFQAAAFTNIGRDHLDYHPDMESYMDAKMRLFSEVLVDGGVAVIDVDRPESAWVREEIADRRIHLLTVGRAGETLRVAGARPDGFGQVLVLVAGGTRHEVHLPLAGSFQVSNALVAGALAMGTGLSAATVLEGLETLTGAAGRLELAGRTAGGALVIIDYAHKPDALENVLHALRPFAKGRLVALFGAGGDRDPGKRPILGEIAARLADTVYVTDDNPRSEEPAAIRAAILAAVPGAIEIGGRREAIAAAIAALEAGDVLVVAGKGHETGQIVGDTMLPFSDHEVVAEILEGR